LTRWQAPTGNKAPQVQREKFGRKRGTFTMILNRVEEQLTKNSDATKLYILPLSSLSI